MNMINNDDYIHIINMIIVQYVYKLVIGNQKITQVLI